MDSQEFQYLQAALLWVFLSPIQWGLAILLAAGIGAGVMHFILPLLQLMTRRA